MSKYSSECKKLHLFHFFHLGCLFVFVLSTPFISFIYTLIYSFCHTYFNCKDNSTWKVQTFYANPFYKPLEIVSPYCHWLMAMPPETLVSPLFLVALTAVDNREKAPFILCGSIEITFFFFFLHIQFSDLTSITKLWVISFSSPILEFLQSNNVRESETALHVTCVYK